MFVVFFYYYYFFRLLETFVGIVMFYEVFGCLLCILLLKYDGILLEKKQSFIKCISPRLKTKGKINVWCSLHTLSTLVNKLKQKIFNFIFFLRKKYPFNIYRNLQEKSIEYFSKDGRLIIVSYIIIVCIIV
jgi:hypothetical protein